MQSTAIPAKIPLPFGASAGAAYIRQIPGPSQLPANPGWASYTDGFPPATFLDVSAGGIPPDGRDVNGILNALTIWLQWLNAGAPSGGSFDATFAAAIGGYPKGATLQAVNPAAVITGSINVAELTVTAGSGIVIGQAVTGLSVAANTVITAGSGTAWTVSIPQTVASETMSLLPQNQRWVSTVENNTANPDLGGDGWIPDGPTAASMVPLMDGAPSVGVSGSYARQDHIHPSDTAKLNTAYLSANTGVVAAVEGAVAVGHIAAFFDTAGTLTDGGQPGTASAPTYINSAQTLAPGVFLVDTSAGAFTVALPGAPLLGASCTLMDAGGTWGTNNLTINQNGKTIMGLAQNMICNIAGEVFRLWYNGSDWRIE